MTNETNTSHAIEINEQNDNEIIELSRMTCEELDEAFEPFIENEEREDHFRHDGEADADALASAGWGTDEDYGGDYDNGWGDW